MTKTLVLLLVRVSAFLAICVSCCGCLIPIRGPISTRVPEGAELHKTVDLTILEPGRTTREQAELSLTRIATGVQTERFILARWAESKWGVIWFGPAGYTAAGGWERHWTVHNAIVDFDEEGLVRAVTEIPDRDLFQYLAQRVQKDPSTPLDLSSPIELEAEHWRRWHGPAPGKLVLRKEVFAFAKDRPSNKKQSNAQFEIETTPDNIRQIAPGFGLGAYDLRFPWVVRVEFKQPVRAGKKLILKMDLPGAFTLMRYVAQTQSAPSVVLRKPIPSQ